MFEKIYTVIDSMLFTISRMKLELVQQHMSIAIRDNHCS